MRGWMRRFSDDRVAMYIIMLARLFCVVSFVTASSPQQTDDDKIPLTIAEHARSLHVAWPAYNSTGDVESNRLRVYPTDGDETRKVVYHSPPDSTELTIGCLDPESAYEVQLIRMFSNNITSEKSDVYHPRTKSESFLDQLWEQRKFVLVGAALMLLVVGVTGGLCFCCCKLCSCPCSRRGEAAVTNLGKKSSLPSADELNNREASQDRYTPHPSLSRPPARPPSTPLDPAPAPPSFWTATRGYSLQNNGLNASERDDVFLEQDIYQNEAFGPQETRHWSESHQEAPVYGNCQF